MQTTRRVAPPNNRGTLNRGVAEAPLSDGRSRAAAQGIAVHPGMVTVEGDEHLSHPDASGVLEQELDIQSTKRLQVGVHGRPRVAVPKHQLDKRPRVPELGPKVAQLLIAQVPEARAS